MLSFEVMGKVTNSIMLIDTIMSEKWVRLPLVLFWEGRPYLRGPSGKGSNLLKSGAMRVG